MWTENGWTAWPARCATRILFLSNPLSLFPPLQSSIEILSASPLSRPAERNTYTHTYIRYQTDSPQFNKHHSQTHTLVVCTWMRARYLPIGLSTLESRLGWAGLGKNRIRATRPSVRPSVRPSIYLSLRQPSVKSLTQSIHGMHHTLGRVGGERWPCVCVCVCQWVCPSM